MVCQYICQFDPYNSLVAGRCGTYFNIAFSKLISWIIIFTTEPYWLWVNIIQCNGLVPTGNKQLPEPMSTQIYVIIWYH